MLGDRNRGPLFPAMCPGPSRHPGPGLRFDNNPALMESFYVALMVPGNQVRHKCMLAPASPGLAARDLKKIV